MTFRESLQHLGIEDYEDRIFNSNSHGELFHLVDYVCIVQVFGNNLGWFRGWFEFVVGCAKETWQRPESIFQHIPRALDEYYEQKERNDI